MSKNFNRIINEELAKEIANSKRINEGAFSTAAGTLGGAVVGGIAGAKSGNGVLSGAWNGAAAGLAAEGLYQLINGNINMASLLKIWQGSDNAEKLYNQYWKQSVGLNWNDFFVAILACGALTKFGANFSKYVGAVKNVVASFKGQPTQNLYGNQQQGQNNQQQQMANNNQDVQQLGMQNANNVNSYAGITPNYGNLGNMYNFGQQNQNANGGGNMLGTAANAMFGKGDILQSLSSAAGF